MILRGLERVAIVKDEADREAFVSRLGAVAQAAGTTIYAWALLPNDNELHPKYPGASHRETDLVGAVCNSKQI